MFILNNFLNKIAVVSTPHLCPSEGVSVSKSVQPLSVIRLMWSIMHYLCSTCHMYPHVLAWSVMMCVYKWLRKPKLKPAASSTWIRTVEPNQVLVEMTMKTSLYILTSRREWQSQCAVSIWTERPVHTSTSYMPAAQIWPLFNNKVSTRRITKSYNMYNVYMSYNFSSSRRLKINHITAAKYAFILEWGTVANNIISEFNFSWNLWIPECRDSNFV